jgi:hypothetical protein
VPRGYATMLGELTSAVLVILTVIFSLFDVDLDAEQLLPLAGAVATVLVVIAGRMAQAAAAYRAGEVETQPPGMSASEPTTYRPNPGAR